MGFLMGSSPTPPPPPPVPPAANPPVYAAGLAQGRPRADRPKGIPGFGGTANSRDPLGTTATPVASKELLGS